MEKEVPIHILTPEEKRAYFDINVKLMTHMQKKMEFEEDDVEGGKWAETIRI